jgi:hypothetical protein
VQSSQKNPTLSSLRSDVPPHKGEGKRYPSWIPAFAGMTF